MAFQLRLFGFLLVALAGCGVPSFLVTPVANSSDLKEQTVQPGEGLFPAKVLIVEVEGTILNSASGGFLRASENPVSLLTQQLDKAAADTRVKAVVLRVNSPGGSVAASDAVYQEILRYRKNTGRPVVAFGQELMASGAYYAACSADRILAQPTSVVGSIGTIFESVEISGTMSLLGVRATAIKSGPMKDMASPFKPLADAEKQIMQEMVDDFFRRFKMLVSQSRKLEGAKLEAVTDGRVFTGDKALALGLLDGLGTLNDALDLARQLGDAPGAEVVAYKRPHGYGGSIYAQAPGGPAQVVQIQLLPEAALLPTGFYYLWEP